MIFLQQERFDRLRNGDKSAVLDALQLALELEHSTIPLYLYTLYSLDPTKEKNVPIIDIIQSVVVEEMLHMTLVCNMINALGGSPVIDKPDFIPPYPGPVPGGFAEDLRLSLRPFSLEQIALFMRLEKPEHELNFPTGSPTVTALQTVGEFYKLILRKIDALGGDSNFNGDPRRQIGPDRMPHAVLVSNTATATAAIHLIVEQGEGTKANPGEVVGNDYAHYYRFAEIYKGRKLIPDRDAPPDAPPQRKYKYQGSRIEADPSGIYPAASDPHAADLPAGSADRYACDNFNYTYTCLLKTLHATFNDEPSRLGSSIGLMMSVKEQAIALMKMTRPDGRAPGPTFEYLPINPRTIS